MDPNTLQLVIFIEQMVALAAKSIADLRNVISGSSNKSVDEILDDADAAYLEIINNAKNPPETST